MSSSDTLQTGGITLDDVGDMAEVKQALTEAVLWPLQLPGHVRPARACAAPRGVLLYGPPGCGKTFLVRALAGTGQPTCSSVKGAELLDKWVGESERAVRELFRRAARGRARRWSSSTRWTRWRRGAGSRPTAASPTGWSPRCSPSWTGSSRCATWSWSARPTGPELIDPALLRPGRLERLVYVPPPDAAARAEILRAAGRNTPLAADVDLDALGADAGRLLGRRLRRAGARGGAGRDARVAGRRPR